MTGLRIRVVDFETTGLKPPEAKVVEVGLCDLVQQADSSWLIEPPRSYLCGVDDIPPVVRAIHHITLKDVAGKEPFCADKLADSFADVAAIACHNLVFDAKFMHEKTVPRICTLKGARRIWPNAPAHSNGVLRYWLEDDGALKMDNPELAQPAHRAGPDAYVTAHILRCLLVHATGKQLATWTAEPGLMAKCPIGKDKGKPWAQVDGGLLSWITRQPEMDFDIVWNAQQELDRRQRGR